MSTPTTAPDEAQPVDGAEAHLEGIDPLVYERRYLILATMCLSLVLIVATVSSVNVAIPSLAKSALRPTDTQILWIVDAYALVFAALLLPAGALGDRYGRKGALLVGLVIFATASAVSAWMTSPTALIATRGLMGVGAALIMPSTLSLLQSVFPRSQRAKAIAIWSAFAGAGGAIGPVLGGLLLTRYWYGSVFFVAVPIAAIAFIASAVLAPRSREGAGAALDPLGALLSIIGFSGLLYSIIEGPDRGWGDGLVVAGFCVAVVALVGFVAHESRTANPMLDMRFFARPRFAMGSLGVTFTFLAMFSMFFVLTQYLQYVRGYSPLAAGLRQLPFAFVLIAVSPRSADFAAKVGARRVVATGMSLLVFGLLLLSFVRLDTPYWYIVVSLMTMASGVGMAIPSLSSGIVQSVPPHKAGVGSAMNDTTREVGGAIGIAVVGSVITSIYRSHVAPALGALPPELAEVARGSIAKAVAVANSAGGSMPPAAATEFSRAVRQSFVDGAHIGLRISAALVAVAAAVVATRLRGRDQIDAVGSF